MVPLEKFRKILHLDLDAFFCSVEELLDPSLKGKAFAVAGQADTRGVVSSCSYPARRRGIRSAMPTARALRLCPDLIIVTPRHHRYGDYSEKVMDILARHTALIQQISVDEAFLDLTDLPQTSRELAAMLQQSIFNELQLPVSVGCASNKLVAKMATDVGKAGYTGDGTPMAITVVPPGSEASFLAPLPVQALWGVGPKTADRLKELGITHIGELAAMDDKRLTQLFGRYGVELGQHARGIDERPVSIESETKSISQEHTFARDVVDAQVLSDRIRELCDQVAYRLRKGGYCATVVRLKIRYQDFSTHTHQIQLPQPIDQDSLLYETAMQLFKDVWTPGRMVRLIGVGASGLGSSTHQLELFDVKPEKERKLLEAVDELKQKYGKDVIRRGSKVQSKKSRPTSDHS